MRPDMSPFPPMRSSVSYSSLCLKQTDVPKRVHTLKRWAHGRCYHGRVQKKWVKRFGWVMEPVMYETPFGFVAHPSFRSLIESAIR